MKITKRLKRIFSPYNIAIFACAVISIISICIALKPDIGLLKNTDTEVSTEGKDEKNTATNTNKAKENNTASTNVQSNNAVKQNSNTSGSSNTNNAKSGENNIIAPEVSEDDARKTAVNKLSELGEKVKAEELEVIAILRGGERFYLVSSPKNTLEIRVMGGKVVRVNSVLVED